MTRLTPIALQGHPGKMKREALARRLTTIPPAMTLAEAVENTRIHRVAGRTGARTAVVTRHPCRAPHHPSSEVGRIGGARCRCRARCRGRTMGFSSWMHGRSSAAMSWRYCANPSRSVSSEYNLQSVINLCDFTSIANRLLAASRSGRGR